MKKHIGDVLPRTKTQRNKQIAIWGAAFLVALMVLSSLAVILDNYSQPDNALTYGNYTFVPIVNGWKTTINGRDITFNFAPDSLETVDVGGAPVIIGSSRVLWITYDPLAEYADVMGGIQYSDDHLLYDIKKIYVQRGLINNTIYPELPQIDCSNATNAEPVLALIQTNDTTQVGARTEGSCVTIIGAFGDDFYRYNERIIYQILGVMD